MEKEGLGSIGYTVLDVVNAILNDVEKPLRKKKPDVKKALLEIMWYREKALKLKDFLDNEYSNKKIEENQKLEPRKVQTYKCFYQCGFTTHSIREIDMHLTKDHGHPDPKRDYNHPIYNES